MDRKAWTKKAMAFVTRSHRHLWGKNNEDPQAFLFKQGLSNQFMKDRLLGWNKFGQQRPLENWGFAQDQGETQKLFLPPGIVVPIIMNKKLSGVFIQTFEEDAPGKTILLHGSLNPFLILKNHNENSLKNIAIIRNLFEGLLTFQELKEPGCVIIYPRP
jgi:hypothetical protein